MMIKKQLFKAFLLGLIFNLHPQYVDFDISMHTAEYPKVVTQNQGLFSFFKRLYQMHNFNTVPEQPQLKIPKIIHQIWLGGKLPDEYREYRKSWIKYHPNWRFIFWTDNPVNHEWGYVVHSFDELEKVMARNIIQHIVVAIKDLKFPNRGFYDQATNYGEKSDILKWEIVYRFGGLYVDTDYECLMPHDTFHHRFDFYTGMQPLDTDLVQLGAALYAAFPKHPILKECVEGIKNNQHIPQIIVKTGPVHFTKSFYASVFVDGLVNAVFPASYFYPMSYEQRGMPASMWQLPESYAIHHWAGSWLKPEAFEKRLEGLSS